MPSISTSNSNSIWVAERFQSLTYKQSNGRMVNDGNVKTSDRHCTTTFITSYFLRTLVSFNTAICIIGRIDKKIPQRVTFVRIFLWNNSEYSKLYLHVASRQKEGKEKNEERGSSWRRVISWRKPTSGIHTWSRGPHPTSRPGVRRGRGLTSTDNGRSWKTIRDGKRNSILRTFPNTGSSHKSHSRKGVTVRQACLVLATELR